MGVSKPDESHSNRRFNWCKIENIRQGNCFRLSAFVPNFDKHPMVSAQMVSIGSVATLPCWVEAAPMPDVSFVPLK